MRSLSALLLAALLVSAGAHAQTYTNPTYTPTAQEATNSLTTTGDAGIILQSRGTTSVRFAGTHGNLVAAVQISNDALSVTDANATWTTIPVTPAGGGTPISSVTANGLYVANTAGATRVRAHVTTMASGTLAVSMAATESVPAPNLAYADPCQSPGVAKSSAVINVGSATTLELVPLTAATTIQVCSFAFTLAGTTPSLTFVTGTGSNCGTGTASLTGAMLPLTGAFLRQGGSGTLVSGASAGALCATVGGTGPSAQGFLTYVKQ